MFGSQCSSPPLSPMATVTEATLRDYLSDNSPDLLERLQPQCEKRSWCALRAHRCGILCRVSPKAVQGLIDNYVVQPEDGVCGEAESREARLLENHAADMAEERGRAASLMEKVRRDHASDLSSRLSEERRRGEEAVRAAVAAGPTAAARAGAARAAELTVEAFLEAYSGGEVIDVSRDGVRGDYLVKFSNGYGLKVEVKDVKRPSSDYAAAAFAEIRRIEAEHGIVVRDVVVVNAHQSPQRWPTGSDDAVSGQLCGFAPHGGVSGQYIAGGAERWQPALRCLCVHVGHRPPMAEREDNDIATLLAEKAVLSTGLADFRSHVEAQLRELEETSRRTAKHRRVLEGKLAELKVQLCDAAETTRQRAVVLQRAVGIVRERFGGVAPIKRVWEERGKEICDDLGRLWPKTFGVFHQELADLLQEGVPAKRAKTEAGKDA